ncbi:MAG TPA: hypothetical protein VH394_12420 [Thermoanaerobaculia bacterium]|jgi:hypothetical protein|nr:hypothetical protein [Thermoanaerobaculia bacterium]
MAFRIQDLTLQLMASGQPGTCTCGPASGAGAPPPPCPGATNKPGGGGKPKPTSTPKKRALNALRAQLRASVPASL